MRLYKPILFVTIIEERSTKPCDKEQWDRLREQTALLRARLLLVWETALELINRRCQIVQDHQDLRLQRQHLLSKQAAYLEDISLDLAQTDTSG